MMDDMMKEMMGKMGEGEGCEMMGKMMEQMMPNCLTMMLPHLPQEKRVDFVLEMVATLASQGSSGMSKEEKGQFVDKVVEKAKAACGG